MHVLFVVLKPQVTKSTDFNKLADEEPWLNATRLVEMLFGKRGKSGLVK